MMASDARDTAEATNDTTGGSAVTTIRRGAQPMTLVNVFTVAPERQQELIDLLVEATERRMRHLPGFISASIHRGDDGAHVVNYAQWRTHEDFNAARKDPEAGVHMQKAAVMAAFNPIVCSVDSVHHA